MLQSTEIKTVVNSIAMKWKHKPGALLPVLHDVQELVGYVPNEAVPFIAKSLNLSRAEVHGVISFYHHFRTKKPGKFFVQICRAEACQSMGGRGLESHVKQKLNVDYHGVSQDELYSLEPVYCLGNCACSPSITICGEIYGRVTPDRFDEIIQEYLQNDEGEVS